MKTKKGFTLVELMIVIAVIGVLAAALGGGAYMNSRKRARDAKKMSELEQLRSELEMIRADSGAYPGSKPGGICDDCNYSGGGSSYRVCVHVDCMIDGRNCSGAGEDYCQGNP